MKLAKKITIDRAQNRVLIDGEVFGYYLAEHGGVEVENPCDPLALPVVRLAILAEDLEVLAAE